VRYGSRHGRASGSGHRLASDAITSDIKATGADEVAHHLAADTGVPEDVVADSAADTTVSSMTARFPIDCRVSRWSSAA
jgi:hypothetical protein